MTLRREVLPSGEASINLPVNMRRLIWNAQERFQCNRTRDSPTGGLETFYSAILVRLLPDADMQAVGVICRS